MHLVSLPLVLSASHLSISASTRTSRGHIEVSMKVPQMPGGWSNIVTTPFTWMSNGDNLWRIDFEEIIGPQSKLVSTTILPSQGNGIVTIQYPTIPEGPRTEPVTNAFVEIHPVEWIPALTQAGAVAVWIGFRLEQIKNLYGPSGDCPPFWSLDPRFFLQKRFTHRVDFDIGAKAIRFMNAGLEPVFDSHGSVKTNGSGPIYRAAQPPIDNGFQEAQLELLEGTVQQPKKYQIVYTAPYADGKTYRLEKYHRFIVTVLEEHVLPENENPFAIVWANTSAKIIDHRIRDSKHNPLVYIVSSNSFDPSIEAGRSAAQKQAEFLKAVRTPATQQYRTLVLIALGAAAITPLTLWIIRRRD